MKRKLLTVLIALLLVAVAFLGMTMKPTDSPSRGAFWGELTEKGVVLPVVLEM